MKPIPVKPCLLAGFLWIGSGCGAAAARPPAIDSAGIVSIEAENFDDSVGWVEGGYYTGRAIRAVDDADVTPVVRYTVHIRAPGDFVVYLLGNRRPNTGTSENVVSLAVARDAGMQAAAARLTFQDHNAPAWTSRSADGGDPPRLSFPRVGTYILRLAAEQGRGMLVDKIVLASSGFVPSGVGPEDTRLDGPVPADGAMDPAIVLPPQWAFGVLYGGYTDQKRSLEIVDQLIAGGYPIDAYWIDSWFWDFVNAGRGPGGYLRFEEDRAAYPDVEAMWSAFGKRRVKAGVWIWDCILREGNESIFDEFARAGALSEPFIERNPWHNSTRLTISANIDFEKPEAVALWRSKMKPLFDKGLDFLKLDRSSAIPFCRTAFEASQGLGRETAGRGFILAHLHSTHDKRHKLYPTKWSGDAKIAWTQPDYPDLGRYAMGGLRENVAMVADPKRTTYEVPFLTHDAGGYDTFGGTDSSEELFVRWMQFSALNSVMTVFSQQTNPTGNLPFNYSPAAQQVYRKYTHLRMRLFPYIYTAALDTRLTGRKPVQGDGVHEDQYLLGRDLLVAPVFAAGATRREVFLPEGCWYEWESDRSHEGGRTITADAPLERIPLYVRAGAILPLRDYASSIEAGSNEHLTLEVWPGAAPSSFTLREDDGTSNDYLSGGFASTTIRLSAEKGVASLEIAPVEGSFAGMKPARSWTIRFHAQGTPRTARLNGREVAFEYDSVARILSVRFSGDTATAHRLTLQ